jgi:hypothetical protein
MYLGLEKTARAVNENGQDWPRLLKSIALPTSDRVYSERSSHTILRATYGLSKQIREQIETFFMMKAQGW